VARKRKLYNPRRRKVCKFCKEGYKCKRNNGTKLLDYKDEKFLRRFITDRGKIIPRRVTGTCAYYQRELTRAVKRARFMALLPYATDQPK